MTDFDDRAGLVSCQTEFGCWLQTCDEVVIEIDVPKGTRAKDVKCDVRTNSITIEVQGKVVVQVCYRLKLNGGRESKTIV